MDENHGEWTDKLSDYLDGELPAGERAAVDSHLAGCAECARVLADLKRVVARAQGLEPRPPQNDLWTAIVAQIEQRPAGHAANPGNLVPFGTRRRVTFTLPQLAAAAVLLIAVSAGLAWTVADRMRGETEVTTAQVAAQTPDTAPAAPGTVAPAPSDDVQVAAVNVVIERRRSFAVQRERMSDDPTALDMVTVAPPRADLTVDFEAAIERLPEGAREIFVLHDVEGYKHREIATMLGITSGTSKRQLHRARMLLRKHLNGQAPWM